MKNTISAFTCWCLQGLRSLEHWCKSVVLCTGLLAFGSLSYANTVIPASAKSPSHWQPNLSDTWQWQLTNVLNTSYEVTIYDVDLFDTSSADIRALQTKGHKVVCYFSAGSAETWRQDYHRIQAKDKGKDMAHWVGEKWLDTRSVGVREIMQSRLTLAAVKGCDGVEPDNVDAYSNKSGFKLTATTQLDYNRFLATEAHRRGLSIGLKNNVDQLAELVDYFDFAINEQCHEFNECDRYSVFIAAGKPVFNAEYADIYYKNPKAYSDLCADSRARNIQTLVLPIKLDDSFRLDCTDTH